jgi:hypothetical protein
VLALRPKERACGRLHGRLGSGTAPGNGLQALLLRNGRGGYPSMLLLIQLFMQVVEVLLPVRAKQVDCREVLRTSTTRRVNLVVLLASTQSAEHCNQTKNYE